jgi:hypothetical protein
MLLAVASPALANSDKKKEGEAAAPVVVKMKPFAAPIIVDGKLINYIFLNLELKLVQGVTADLVEPQEPILRDAIVRAAHKASFNRPDSYNLVDEPRVKALVLREATTLVGKGKVAAVEIAKQIPRKQLPPPPGAKPVLAPAPSAAAAHH